MKKNVGLKDIADKTGFSIKTVSRAINNHPDVNETTRQKILSVAKEYSYYPNLAAKSLHTKKAFTIGYIVPDITNEFYGEIGIVLEKEFRQHGYSLLISFTEESEENEINSLKLLLAKRVDGIVLATVGTTGEFLKEVINRYQVPVVVCLTTVTDLLAALQAPWLKPLRGTGLRVIKKHYDVALVVYDNLEFTEAIDPPLTTLDKVEDEIGRIASNLLLEKIKNKDIENVSEYFVKARLCIRRSCGCK